MSSTDSVAEFLTKIRNAVQSRHLDCSFSRSNLKEEICRILKREHFIKDYEVIKDSRQGAIKVIFAYGPKKEPLINGIRRISKPGLRQYRGYKDLRPVKGGLGILIISTPKGVMTDKECNDSKAGGEVICEVW
jgi:small subunit ribosomal protein S8